MGGGADDALRPYVPGVAVDWLAHHPEKRHRSVEGTLAFVDISGFTALARRLTRQGAVGSEELSDILDAVFGALLAHARHEGGDLVKWGGDAVLLLFTGSEHATRAARAAVDMRNELRSAGRARSSAGAVSLRMSVGIHTGWFDFFLVGAPHIHRELVISGPAASRCAEMEALATASQIMLSTATAAALDQRLLGEHVGEGRLLRSRPPSAPAYPVPDVDGVRVDVGQLLSPPLRRHLLAAAGTSEHRTVGVSFVEFSGTDALLAEQGPDALADALDEMVHNAQDACASHGVTFLESDINRDGGKLMLVAGAPGGGRDVEDRAHGAARLIVDRAGTLSLRAGVNRGGVYGGDFGPSFRRTYSLKGDAINLAARVMGKTLAGDVLATEAVIEHLRRPVDAVPVPPFLVKGVTRPVDASSVRAVLDEPGLDSAAPRGAAPLRAAELARVRPLLERSMTGRGGVVQVVADPGLGKSAFVAAVVEEAAGHVVRRGSSGHFGGAVTYGSVRRLLRDVAGVGGGTPRDEVVAAVRSVVVERCPELLPYFPLLGAVLDVRIADTPETRDLDERFRAGKVVETVVSLLQAALDAPSLLVFEDVDEMDESSATIVAELAAAAAERPWLVVTSRQRGPGGLSLPDDLVVEEIDLLPLGHDESVALLESWSVERPVSQHLLEAIAVKAGGNPLFMEALLDVARDRGSIADLPDSVGAVVAGQIDRLTPRDRTVLRFASVLGDQFSFALLQEMVGDEGWQLDPGDLRRLDQFVEPEGANDVWWRFTNAVVRDAAYAGLPFRLRRRMHRHVGEVLEKLSADPDQLAAQLATHFWEAGDHARAWRYGRTAAERARGVYSYAAALEEYRRAVTAAIADGEVPRGEIAQVLEATGDVAELAGLSREAIAAYRQARQYARADPVAVATLMFKEVGIHQRIGQLTTALRIVAHARGLVREESSRASAVRSQLTSRLAFFNYLRARHPEALTWSALAVLEAQGSGDDFAVASAFNVRDLVLTGAGQTGEQPFGELALASYEKAGNLLMMSRCLINLAIRALQEGRWPLAQERLERAAELMMRIGDTANGALSAYNLADLAIRQGRFARAEMHLQHAARYARIADDVELVALVTRETARVRVGQGRVDDARVALAEARAELLAAGLEHEVVEVEVGLADCALLESDLVAARRIADAALDTVTAGGPETALGAVHLLAGVVGLREGAPETAEASFERGLSSPDAGEGGCVRALNLLGRSLARAAAGRPDEVDLTAALATLRELDVEVLPHGLDELVRAVRAPTSSPACP
jgi:class 3 adenylate cyclase/predicted negative regulator of RcsB-dependent stress response